jgi:hypothetical protein
MLSQLVIDQSSTCHLLVVDPSFTSRWSPYNRHSALRTCSEVSSLLDMALVTELDGKRLSLRIPTGSQLPLSVYLPHPIDLVSIYVPIGLVDL